MKTSITTIVFFLFYVLASVVEARADEFDINKDVVSVQFMGCRIAIDLSDVARVVTNDDTSRYSDVTIQFGSSESTDIKIERIKAKYLNFSLTEFRKTCQEPANRELQKQEYIKGFRKDKPEFMKSEFEKSVDYKLSR